jgi:hypothetical protein
LANAGTVDVASGTLTFNQFVQTAGSTILDGGNVSGPLLIQGGVLTGAGTVFGSVSNQGQVSPGQPVGLIDVQGAYTQSAPGSLAVRLDGLSAGSQYSQLEGDSGITLGGPLQVSLVSGYTPHLGDTFTIVKNGGSAAMSGTFVGLPEGAYFVVSGYVFQISYAGGGGHDATLTVTKIATTTTVTASLSNPLPGQAVTLMASVSPAVTGLGTPGGSVDFFDSTTNTDLGSVPLSGGSATLSTSYSSLDGHTITATYSGDAEFFSSSGSTALTVIPSASLSTPPPSSSCWTSPVP